MALIEPHASWQPLEARAATTDNALHRQLLTEVARHMAHEIRGEIDALMDTLIAEPVYHFWNENPFVLEGAAAVRGFYENMIAGGGNQFEVVVERIFVDDGGVVTEGQVRQVYGGAAVQAMGLKELDGAPLSDDDLLLTTTQLITVWPAGEGAKLVGEDIYFGHSPLLNARRITEDDLPDYYVL
ncbi:MAG: nuclear transport factor 2 family protein [Pseudomonadota bacterium]